MLLQLDIQLSPVLECPLHNIRLRRCSLNRLALLELGPELAEVLELDEVPDAAEGRFDHSRLVDRGGGWDSGHRCCWSIGELGDGCGGFIEDTVWCL